MIISRTPLRISFLGGGTDYPAYFQRYGGATLVAAIDKYTVLTVHRLMQFADHRIRIHYSQVESVQRLEEIRHPSARECLRFMGVDGGIEIHYVSDLPARTGLGSSSSATVGLLHALHRVKGESVNREQLAAEAVHVEQRLIGERVGCQDQYACAIGGLSQLEFHPDGHVTAHPVALDAVQLELLREHLLLLYTGIQRDAHLVLQEQLERTAAGDNTDALHRLKALVGESRDVLANGKDLTAFGRLLHEGWMLKRELSSRVSTSWIDDLYRRALTAGAVGGKLLGAGSGGFLLLFVEPSKRGAVRQALQLREVEFAFEREGSRIIFHEEVGRDGTTSE